MEDGEDAHNYVLMNMLGLDQTSRKILKDDYVPIFPVVLFAPNHKVYLKATCLS